MSKYVLTDAEVKLTGYLSEKKYPESFRLIRYYYEEGDREFTFLTNATHISALDAAIFYKKRWLVGLFFKWLKQHLKIKDSGAQRKTLSAFKSVLRSSLTVSRLLSNTICN